MIATDRRFDCLLRAPLLSHEAVDGLRVFLGTAPDDQLYRINPLNYAAERGLTAREAIDLFVNAAHAGLFEFSWDLTCVSCGCTVQSSRALRELQGTSFCNLCEVENEVALDDMIEVSFTVSPSVRPIRFHRPQELPVGPDLFRVLFSDNRILHPEIERLLQAKFQLIAQAAGGTEQAYPLHLSEGGYRMISLTHHALAYFDVVGAPIEEPQVVQVDFVDGAVRLGTHRVRPGPITFEVRNRNLEPVVWSLSKRPPARPADIPCEFQIRFRPFVNGRRLLTSQSFRDLYRTESLSPGTSFKLRSMTFLFTDLKGSTALYDRIGDLRAYDLVQEHFRILSETVALHEGAIVKTIGDAIMATFPAPRTALEATVLMHRRLDDWNQGHGAEELTLKVGIHVGPCIAVNSNDRLDYFGHTVNTAARIQGLAESRETYFSETVHSSLGVQDALRGLGLRIEPKTAQLKGISEEVKVYRALLP